MGSFLQDLRFATRALGKSPWFAVLAVVTLALGIAVNAAIFSAINGFLLRPIAAKHPEQLTVLVLQQAGDGTMQRFSYPDYKDLRDETNVFSGLAAWRVTLGSLMTENRGDHSIITRVTGNYFSMLGIQPALGRLILPSEGQTPGADPVIVLGYSYWHKRFGGDPNVVGRHVELNGHPMTIVGVAPKGFNGTYSIVNSDLYVPLSADIGLKDDNKSADLWTKRGERSLALIGRLKAGVDRKQAEAAVNVEAQRLAHDHADVDKGISVRVLPENSARPDPGDGDSLRPIAAAFMVLAGLVLLVASFNVSNVLLVRATVRQREMAIRAALGAGRSRLIRQCLTESLLLALLGGAGGMLLAYWATDFVASISLGTDLPVQLNVRPDGRVYVFALLAVVVTGFIVGMFPAMRVSRRDVGTILHEGGRGSSAGRKRQWVRGTLVVAQVAGSLVLLVVAGLFVRSLGKAEKVSLGFDPNNVLDFTVDVQQAGFDDTRGRDFYRELETRLRDLPGVVSVGQAFTVPLGIISGYDNVYIEGHAVPPGEQPPSVQYNMVSTGYFETLRIPLHQGRTFTESDNDKTPAVAIISEAMAKKFWPNQEALGKRFSTKGAAGPFIQVVGVVQDGKYRGVTEEAQPFFYRPLLQQYAPMRTIHLRTSVPPQTLSTQVQAVVREIAPNLPVTELQTMNQAIQGVNGFLFFRLGAQLTTTMGLLGLVLAVVGVYSVASYAAAQRTHEIGIRMAVGAMPKDILRMVLRQGFGVVGIGLATGLAVAFAGTRLLASVDVFYGVKASDPVTYGVVATLLLGVALFACWVPAWRATRVTPLKALRFE